MKIAFNPSNSDKNILDLIKNNKDIIFDLKGHSIFARGVEFKGTDTWRPVVDNLISNSTTSSLSANQGRVLKSLIDGKSNSGHTHDDRYLKLTGGTMTGNIILSRSNAIIKPLASTSNYDSIVSWSVDGETKKYGREIGLHNLGGSNSTGSIAIVPYKTDTEPWSGTVGLFIAKDTLKLDGKPIAFKSDIPSSLKNPYSLNVFGVTYDGSTAKVVSPSNFISQVTEATGTVTDGTMFITSWASDNGFADTNAVNVPYKRKAIHLWEYIKAKTDSLYTTKGHNHDDRYLKLTGGTMTGTIRFNNLINIDSAIVLDYKYSAGGFARDIVSMKNSVYGDANLGALSILCYPNSTSNGFQYIYLGTDKYYGPNNLRIYKDKVTFGDNILIDAGNIGSQSVAYASKAGNADTVDGYHANSLLTALSNSNNGISITVGGTTKSVSNISVNYAASAGSASSATQATNLTPENTPHYFRDPSSSAWRGGMYWGNAGNESMSFVVGDSRTRFQFVGGSDIANWTSSTWQSVTPYLTIYSSGIVTPGSVTANNWFRSQGASGWYSETYGGGIYMTDTSWIRTYGDKPFYCDNQIYSSNSIRMSNIYLQNIDEINNGANGALHLNYRNSGNITLCNGGGAVTIGTTSTDIGGNKLYVNGSEFINGASNVKDHVFANGFRHRSHNSNDSVLLAGGGYSQGVPVRYWAIYSMYIGNSSTDVTYTKRSGNYNFITSEAWESEGAARFDISFPSGYNKNNTLIFGNGDHRTSSSWKTPVYVTITTSTAFGGASQIRVMISDDASLNVGFANIYFMCMG